MTTEQPVDLHKHDRRVQSTHEFTKKVSLVLRMLKYVSHISYRNNVFALRLNFFFFFLIFCADYMSFGGMKTYFLL
jgi:hypothetical protein